MHFKPARQVRNHALLLFVLFLSSCKTPEEKAEALAQKYCASCHAFPDPSLLDKKTWKEGVMPQMAFRMGVDLDMLWEINRNELDEISKSLPDRPLVTEEEWQAITKYFDDHAPERLEISQPQLSMELPQFTAEQYSLPSPFPSVTHVLFDSATSTFLIGTRQSMLFKLDNKFSVTSSTELPSPVSFIDKTVQPWIISCMGVMDPNDLMMGTIQTLDKLSLKSDQIIDSLKRPVYVASADFNNDNRLDYLVSEFGNYTGRLVLYEQKEKAFSKHPIHYLPGTRKTILTDFDDDGVTDIIALVTQGDEQIVLYRGHGDFNFTPEVLLRFPPVYGSSYFDLVDMDLDGDKDILYTNGDNADYSQILKPYHGVRIFINNGKAKFSEKTFLLMHGASMAVANDFDGDKDIDIAAVSFFPDFQNSPASGFIYFENINGEFKARSNAVAESGRWLTISAADIDGDLDQDLIVGALNFPNGVPETLSAKWQKENISLLVLRNKRF